MRVARALLAGWMSLLCVLLPLGTGLAIAAPLDGRYEVTFTGTDSIWPFTDFQDCESDVINGLDVEMCLNMSFTRSGRGKVSGSGTFDFSAQGIGVDIQGTLAGTVGGSIRGSDQKGYKQAIGLKYQGTVTVSGVGGNLPASMSGKLTTTITPAGLVESKGSVRVKIKRGLSTKARVQTGLAQIPEESGDWTVVLTLSPSADQKKLSGTAELVLHDGRRFIPVTGTYHTGQDRAQVFARGRGSNRGIDLQVRNVRSNQEGVLEGGTTSYFVQGFSGKSAIRD